MASRIEGYDEKIIACAKEEFLKKGYADASLRTIAQNADVSTSTIYTRYLDKEGLFRFLVEPSAKGLKDLIGRSLSEFTTLSGSEQSEKMTEYSDKGFEETVPYIYRGTRKLLSGIFGKFSGIGYCLYEIFFIAYWQ